MLEYGASSLDVLVVLNEFVYLDGKKPTRGQTRSWIKRRKEKDYFTNIIREKIEG